MKTQLPRYNTYLLAALLAFAAGCASSGKKEKDDVKEDASLRLHLEVNPDGTEDSAAVLIGRAAPFLVNLEKAPFLTEHRIERASLVESQGSYSISVKFNHQGSMILEQYTTPHKSRRIGVAAVFGEQQLVRWVAAPRITHSITNGVFIFTPAATREEADRIVAGLNNFAEKNK